MQTTSNTMGLGRRDELAIIKDLLTNITEPRRLTHILYKTNLSYTQLRRYLASLMQMGFAEKIDEPFRGFKITSKGRTFIDLVSVEPNNCSTVTAVDSP